MIAMKNVCFHYPKSDRYILDNLSMVFEKGKLYAIMGPSGTGKSTFLSLISGLEMPQEGEILINDTLVSRNTIREQKIAFIFQNYQLFPYLSAVENVAIAMEIRSPKCKDKYRIAENYLHSVGLSDKEYKRKVSKLSGGEQQRVGIARALAIQSEYILADEPTGNLDTKNADIIIQKLSEIAHTQNCCVIVVTHSERIKSIADVVYNMEDGMLKLVESF